MATKYTRVYSDESGESHFEDVEIDFKTIDFAPPAPPLDVSEVNSASQYAFIKAPVGWSGEWHPAPYRQLHIYLSGEVEAEVSDGEVRQFGAGSVVLVEDIVGKGHRSRVIGSTEVVLSTIRLDEHSPNSSD